MREIMLDNYCKTVLIEANTMIDMANALTVPKPAEVSVSPQFYETDCWAGVSAESGIIN